MIADIELGAMPDGPRREPRADVQIPVALRQQGCNAFSADVSNLSRHGFRVETHIPIAVDSYVWLRLPGLAPLAARIAWTHGLTHGCYFVDPLHPAVAEKVIAAHATA